MAVEDKWVFYRDKRNDWRWRRTAPNGEIVGAATEGYRNQQGCVANAIRNGYTHDTWKLFQDRSHDWRWRRTAPNHRIVGASTEGYRNRRDCLQNARRHGYWGR